MKGKWKNRGIWIGKKEGHIDWREGRAWNWSEGKKYGLERRKGRDWRGER